MVIPDSASALSLWRCGSTCAACINYGGQTHRSRSIGSSRATSLVGLNSADFLVDGERFWLLEVNPRPGATLDIFETTEHESLRRNMWRPAPANLPPHPVARRTRRPPALSTPKKTSPLFQYRTGRTGLPICLMAGSAIKAGDPVCTVYACDLAAETARELAEKRRQAVLSWTRARNS